MVRDILAVLLLLAGGLCLTVAGFIISATVGLFVLGGFFVFAGVMLGLS